MYLPLYVHKHLIDQGRLAELRGLSCPPMHVYIYIYITYTYIYIYIYV